jgi:hypothetical protein
MGGGVGSMTSRCRVIASADDEGEKRKSGPVDRRCAHRENRS